MTTCEAITPIRIVTILEFLVSESKLDVKRPYNVSPLSAHGVPSAVFSLFIDNFQVIFNLL